MKKIYVDAYQNVNFGDDLFLKILFNRYPEMIFYIRDNHNYRDIFKEYRNVLFYKIGIFDRIVHRADKVLSVFREEKGFRNFIDYSRYDAYLNIGGSIFNEFDSRNFIEKKYKIENFLRYNKNVFILGCNFDKVKDIKFLNRYKAFFKKMENEKLDICFRDNYSYNLFSQVRNIRKATDIVFNIANFQMGGGEVGFSIIDLERRMELKVYEENYLNNMLNLIRYFLRKKYLVNLFSFCKNEGDLIGIEKICKRLSKKEIEFLKIWNYDGNIDKFIKKVSSMSYMIATRFHANILAIIFRQKLLPVIYSDKTLNILKDFGMLNFVLDIRKNNQIDLNFFGNRIEENVIDSRTLCKLTKEAALQFYFLDRFVERKY